MNWAWSADGQASGRAPPARARRGSTNRDTGSPVARDLRPTIPAPNSVDRMLSRRVIIDMAAGAPSQTDGDGGGGDARRHEGGLERGGGRGAGGHGRPEVGGELGRCGRRPRM